MHYRLLCAGALLLSGCSQRLSNTVSTRTAAAPEDTFDCVRKQMTNLGYKQTSIDLDAHRVSGVKFDVQSRRPDTQFRRLVHRMEVEVAAEADGQTSITIQPRTLVENTTQRGPTEIEEKAAEEVRTAAQQLVERCRS
jgi:hypothetical protein